MKLTFELAEHGTDLYRKGDYEELMVLLRGKLPDAIPTYSPNELYPNAKTVYFIDSTFLRRKMLVGTITQILADFNDEEWMVTYLRGYGEIQVRKSDFKMDPHYPELEVLKVE